MHLSRLRRVLILGGVLLLALPAAQAKKPDVDGAYPDESPRGQQLRGRARDADANANRIERRRNDREHNFADERSSKERRAEGRPRYEQPNYGPAPGYQDNRQDARPQSRGKSLSEAVSEAEHRTGGRVLSADPGEENGERYYRVKVLTPNGRVQILYLDAR